MMSRRGGRRLVRNSLFTLVLKTFKLFYIRNLTVAVPYSGFAPSSLVIVVDTIIRLLISFYVNTRGINNFTQVQ